MAKILIVDDNEDMLLTLEHLFQFYEFDVVKAVNGKEGIEVAVEQKPDLIILDALMPVMNGFEACKILKNNPETKEIPVVFLSANYVEEEHRVMGLELGADDYIVKPFNAKELIAKVKSILHKINLIENLRLNNKKLMEEHNNVYKELEQLRKKTSELEAGQITDPLTGLYNLSFFEKRFKEEVLRSNRYTHPICLVVVDVDFFHKINEVFGEQTGDYILMRIANVILNNTRHTDIVFHSGRNRFLLILPQTDEMGGYFESERIRSAIDQTSFFDKNFYELKKLSPKRKQDYQHITVSIGLAEADFAEDQRGDLLQQHAEQALMFAKANGRNQSARYSKMPSKVE
jgi:diguanylate cyclase (GGDEF)-like protein